MAMARLVCGWYKIYLCNVEADFRATVVLGQFYWKSRKKRITTVCKLITIGQF
jgi:hypothetical protein